MFNADRMFLTLQSEVLEVENQQLEKPAKLRRQGHDSAACERHDANVNFPWK